MYYAGRLSNYSVVKMKIQVFLADMLFCWVAHQNLPFNVLDSKEASQRQKLVKALFPRPLNTLKLVLPLALPEWHPRPPTSLLDTYH
jgi:hypothetical protein